MKNEKFNPYIPDAEPLTAEAVDRHLESLPRPVYYGEMPKGVEPVGRDVFPPIEVWDDSGKTKFNVGIAGDLATAKQLMIMTMAWSDSPTRGFEALREMLTASPELAVMSVSFPGAGPAGDKMTEKQKESLKGPYGDFTFISAQQWATLLKAFYIERERLHLDKGISDYDFLITGKSQGTSNTVGLLQTAPEGLDIAGVGMVQGVALGSPKNAHVFRAKFPGPAFKKYFAYNAVNPYGEKWKQDYPAYGPPSNPAVFLKHWASHIGAIAEMLARGGDVNRLIKTIHEKELYDTLIIFSTGTLDKIAVPSESQAAAEWVNAGLKRISKPAIAKTVIWPGHYHSAVENLANAKTAFRSIAQ